MLRVVSRQSITYNLRCSKWEGLRDLIALQAQRSLCPSPVPPLPPTRSPYAVYFLHIPNPLLLLPACSVLFHFKHAVGCQRAAWCDLVVPHLL